MKKKKDGSLILDKDGLPTPDPMVDTYYDNDKYDAAKNDMAIRYRWTEGNATGAWTGLMCGSRILPPAPSAAPLSPPWRSKSRRDRRVVPISGIS